MANFAEWLSEASAPGLAVVSGGRVEDFVRAVVTTRGRRRRVFCDSAMAKTVALVANLEMVPLPGIEMITSLRKTLQEIRTGADGDLTIVPFPVLRGALQRRARRVIRDMEIAIGYPVPAPLVMKGGVEELGSLLTEIAARGRSPVAVHDLTGALVPSAVASATFFADPLESEGSAESAAGQLSIAEVVDGTVEDIPIESALAHAEFILSSADISLREMHRPFASPAFRAVRDYVLRQLDRHAADPERGEKIGRAAERLRTFWPEP